MLTRNLREAPLISRSHRFARLRDVSPRNRATLGRLKSDLAVTDVLLVAEKHMNNHHDWYSILQLDRRSDDQELIKKLSAGADDCNVVFRRLWHMKFSFFLGSKQ